MSNIPQPPPPPEDPGYTLIVKGSPHSPVALGLVVIGWVIILSIIVIGMR